MNKTKEIYGFLWSSDKATSPSLYCHYKKMQEVVREKIVGGTKGIDIGSGNGLDTYAMAKENPSTEIISMDISDGVKVTKKLTNDLKNVYVVKGSALNIPFKNDIFDFAYSFGVIHHTENPSKGISEIKRIIKRDSPTFLYLYEDHSENPLKYYFIKAVTIIRKITVKIPPETLYLLCYFLSPFVVVLFSYPAKIFKKFKKTAKLHGKMPFNFGTTLFSLRGDLYDRFGAPVEFRYSRSEAVKLLSKEGFVNNNITRLKTVAGWVLWGFKTSKIIK